MITCSLKTDWSPSGTGKSSVARLVLSFSLLPSPSLKPLPSYYALDPSSPFSAISSLHFLPFLSFLYSLPSITSIHHLLPSLPSITSSLHFHLSFPPFTSIHHFLPSLPSIISSLHFHPSLPPFTSFPACFHHLFRPVLCMVICMNCSCHFRASSYILEKQMSRNWSIFVCITLLTLTSPKRGVNRVKRIV